MKIAIPVNDKSMDKGVCPSFGRAPYFLVYDTETKKGDFIDNGAASSQGGAGIKAAQLIVDNGADALITPRCGENAASVIKTGQVRIYRSIEARSRRISMPYRMADCQFWTKYRQVFNHGEDR